MAEYCMKCMMPVNGEEPCPHCGHTGEFITVPHRLAPGTILIDRYLIGTAIGQGGFGITYMARDLRLNMRVAVKEYYPNGYTNRNTAVSSELTISDQNTAEFIDEGKKKFLSEARALARFHEERGVVEVRDFFEENKTAYIVMEYLDGLDLRKHLKKSLFTADEIFELMKPVMDALEKIHEVGIVHRDISPDNIMLLKNGTVKLMDFGAARLLDLSDQKSVSVVLKAGYAPEEQYRPKGKQGPWTDIYALCATMYKCITGITPDDALERTHKDELKWPSEMGIEITVLQEDVLKKGMAVKSEERFQNISEMKAMLEKTSVNHFMELEAEDEEATVYIPRKKTDEAETVSRQANVLSQETAPVKEPVAPPEEKKEVVTSNKKISPAVIGGIAAAVAVIGGMALFGGGNKQATEPSSGSEYVTEAAESEKETEHQEAVTSFASDDYIHIILEVGEGSSVKGFNESVETLRERLEIFSGEEPFHLEVVDDKVDVYLPKSGLGDYDLYGILRCYLTRATDLYAFRKTENVGFNPEKIAIDREDLAEVTMMEGAIEGFDVSGYGVTSDTYPYLKVVFTDKFVDKHREEIESWGKEFTFAQDMSSDQYYYFDTISGSDGKTFYIFNKDLEGSCLELMHYNLTHAPLEKSFSFWTDLSYRADWDETETAGVVGENQCNVDEVTGDTLTAYLTCHQDGLSAGELLDAEAIFKARLDTLDQPYAFGWEEAEGRIVAAVKTGTEHVGIPILGMLGSTYGVRLRAGLAEKTLYYTDSHTFSYEKAEDGTYRVTLELNAADSEDTVHGLTSALAESGGGELMLMLDEKPFLSAQVEETISGNAVVFDQVYLPERGPITEETLWVAEFAEEILCGAGMKNTFTYSNDQYSLFSDDPRRMADVKFGVSYDYLGEEIAERLEETIGEEPEIWIDGNTVKVQYDLEVNETLPEEVLRLGRETYEASGFEDSVFNQLFIYFIRENNEEKERVRIMFDKIYAEQGIEGEESYIRARGIFANGRAARYAELFRSLKEEDSFYQELNHGNWQYE